MTLTTKSVEIRRKLAYRFRLNQLWLLLGVLTIGVGITVWLGVPDIFILAGIAAWVVTSIHLSFTETIHQIEELNWTITAHEVERRREQGLS